MSLLKSFLSHEQNVKSVDIPTLFGHGNAKSKGDTKCTTPHLYEDDIKELFVVALSKLLVDREALLEDGRLIRHELMDTSAIDTE